MPNFDIGGSGNIVSILISAVLIYGVAALLKIRKDIREDRKSKFDLFEEVKRVAQEQIDQNRADMTVLRTENAKQRIEISELRDRVDAAERRATTAASESERISRQFESALVHLASLEEAMRHGRLTVPERPAGLIRRRD
jgi:uncharacterized protein (DUF3084 family)